ncbi:MAG: adenosylmethionine--8-amino-7-oxononanoate transaminase [Lysobacterales bacterium]
MFPGPKAQALASRDLNVLWHPCTQMHDHQSVPMVPIARGEGAWLIDADGHRLLDAISSWWVNLFGHGHPRIARAISEQAGRLEQVILAGFTHEPAIRLAEGLLALAPPGLARVFYADNGSSAIEVALKMSFHYWRNQGAFAKTRFMALAGGYHGETLGALSVTDVPLYRETYEPLLLQPLFAPSPDSYLAAPGETAEAYADRAADALEQLLAENADTLAALILEPLVQGAAGMRMYPASYLKRARAACDRFGVHLIADEIMVGFGRTGTLFACEQAAISPDFLCLSKGITGGFLPLSAVLTTQSVFNAFYAEYQSGRAFLHSHSYTGNALACAAACEVLAMFREEDWLQRNRASAACIGSALERFKDHPNVADVRQTGMIAAIELVRDRRSREPFDWRERRGLAVYRHALERGVLLRPLGNVVYFLPPYCISADEIELMATVAMEGIERAVAAR